MGKHRACVVVVRLTIPFLLVFSMISGCQVAPSTTGAALVEHREQIDDSGLALPVNVDSLKANISPPATWQMLPLQKTAMYTHRQWRSTTKRTAVGVTYVRLPLPLSAKTLGWFASNEVSKRTSGGRLIRQWSDPLGREWFEAENSKYHMTGYVMTRGLDAWINYCGYRVTEAHEPQEYDLARRSLDTILPMAAMGNVAKAESEEPTAVLR